MCPMQGIVGFGVGLAAMVSSYIVVLLYLFEIFLTFAFFSYDREIEL